MAVYYNVVLPQEQPVFDGFAFVVGTAPTRVGPEPIIQVLSETDVTNPAHAAAGRRRVPPLGGRGRRALRAGRDRSTGVPLSARDLGAVPVYDCTNPPLSRRRERRRESAAALSRPDG